MFKIDFFVEWDVHIDFSVTNMKWHARNINEKHVIVNSKCHIKYKHFQNSNVYISLTLLHLQTYCFIYIHIVFFASHSNTFSIYHYAYTYIYFL